MSTYQDVERDIRQMANYWLLRKFQFLDWTNDVFFSYIDPHNELDKLDDDKQVIMSMCFTEWLLFECPLRDGLTPLSLYLNERPARVSQQALDRLLQVRDTQFFSRFAILKKDAATGVSTLKDVRTGRCYDVYDQHLCEVKHWKNGTIAERIGPVLTAPGDGRPGAHVRPRRAECHLCRRPGRVHPEDHETRPELEAASYFIRLARDLLSPDGRYQDTLKVRMGVGIAKDHEVGFFRHPTRLPPRSNHVLRLLNPSGSIRNAVAFDARGKKAGRTDAYAQTVRPSDSRDIRLKPGYSSTASNWSGPTPKTGQM